ncbi:hypothetical protein IWQ61_008879 [Dispira simplex]|nr:hypothetical protein IWQ61_008879 [Dispira simplex]
METQQSLDPPPSVSSSLTPGSQGDGYGASRPTSTVNFVMRTQFHELITENLSRIYQVPDTGVLWPPTMTRSVLDEVTHINTTLPLRLTIAIYANKLLERSIHRLRRQHETGRHRFSDSNRLVGTYEDMIHFYLAALILSTEDIVPLSPSSQSGTTASSPTTPTSTEPVPLHVDLYDRVQALVDSQYKRDKVDKARTLIRSLLGKRTRVTCQQIAVWARDHRGYYRPEHSTFPH